MRIGQQCHFRVLARRPSILDLKTSVFVMMNHSLAREIDDVFELVVQPLRLHNCFDVKQPDLSNEGRTHGIVRGR